MVGQLESMLLNEGRRREAHSNPCSLFHVLHFVDHLRPCFCTVIVASTIVFHVVGDAPIPSLLLLIFFAFFVECEI